jgi:hypothetical protein
MADPALRPTATKAMIRGLTATGPSSMNPEMNGIHLLLLVIHVAVVRTLQSQGSFPV